MFFAACVPLWVIYTIIVDRICIEITVVSILVSVSKVATRMSVMHVRGQMLCMVK